ncbi:MAG: class A beta-lactamase-related serine hydrolase [Actinobacteria bacterium]|nr:class A beta-lactamase-related serine hydrolase [Actinomycetota bacterium]
MTTSSLAPSGHAASDDIADALREVFTRAGAQGFVHAVDVDSGREVGLLPDEPVVTASTFKVPVLLELVLQAAEGRISLTDRVRVPAEGRAPGPTGLSVWQDEVELSVRDLASSMITVSDNCATDVVCDLVGLEHVQARLDGMGLSATRIPYDCRALFATGHEDLGGPLDAENMPSDEALAGMRMLDPAQTDATTPRAMTDLLGRIWRDEAGPAEACAEVRRVMGLQVWPHRLTAGFPAEVSLAGKTGTLPSVFNEVAVATYPDGGRYAVAVFTRSSSYAMRQPLVDRAIGEAGRLAVDALRRDAG